ncbi:MAG: hypothetical protein VYE81_02025, partial [Planctomycetota bacterium]|nr:hypothetical protein [Planctomycetota bacterium]
MGQPAPAWERIAWISPVEREEPTAPCPRATLPPDAGVSALASLGAGGGVSVEVKVGASAVAVARAAEEGAAGRVKVGGAPAAAFGARCTLERG